MSEVALAYQKLCVVSIVAVKMKGFPIVVFLSILAISHYVEAKPAGASPDASTKNKSSDSKTAVPLNNGKPGSDDVPTTLVPVGSTVITNGEVPPLAPGATPSTTLSSSINITTVAPTSMNGSAQTHNVPTTTAANTTTTQSSSSDSSPTTTTIASTTTTNSSSNTEPTTLPTSTSSKPIVTSPIPFVETSTQSIPVKDRRFDGPSFIGGIVLSLGTMAIGFVAFKFYKARTERNYHTL
ncbi:sialomucin core protein 24-like [Schistocerca serialis cubense]|uniref:sialomucin core protein 24-like n=1 Tax=Schistocerca serialis cubense TaxID=2023355 RepID=UPI00214ED560|nr:sialomucin core protein 24-like [Schistocerca serialis cubense]